MDRSSGLDVVLITGGSGFLGQHLVREMQLQDSHNLKEIRVLDLIPFTNKLKTGRVYPTPVVSFTVDICDKEAARDAFRGATCVMHLAAFTDYSFPADLAELHRVNVKGTETVIELCKEENVPILIHCSSTEVTMRPRLGPFPIAIGLTEYKAEPPYSADDLPPYAASKLRAERVVLAENMTYLQNAKDRLRVVVLRPAFLYGELEPRIIQGAVKAASWNINRALIDLQGPGGPGCKLQFAYAGNAAWAFVCAKECMKLEPTENPNLSACGQPVFVTDASMVQHPMELVSQLVDPRLAHFSSVWLPLLLTYPAASLVEKLAGCLKVRLPLQPTHMIAMLGGLVYFDGLRAAICLRYTPLYTESEAMDNTRLYFDAFFRCKDD